MKKKLFAVVIVVFIYVLFVFAFTSVDKQDKVSQLLSKIGLSSATAIASPSTNQVYASNSDINLKASFRNPIPPPAKKPPPRPKGGDSL